MTRRKIIAVAISPTLHFKERILLPRNFTKHPEASAQNFREISIRRLVGEGISETRTNSRCRFPRRISHSDKYQALIQIPSRGFYDIVIYKSSAARCEVPSSA